MINYKVNSNMIDVYLDEINIISFVCINIIATIAIRKMLDEIPTEQNNLLFLFHLKRITALDKYFAYTVNFNQLAKMGPEFDYNSVASLKHFINFCYNFTPTPSI